MDKVYIVTKYEFFDEANITSGETSIVKAFKSKELAWNYITSLTKEKGHDIVDSEKMCRTFVKDVYNDEKDEYKWNEKYWSIYVQYSINEQDVEE